MPRGYECDRCGGHHEDAWVIEEPGWGGSFYLCSLHCLIVWAGVRLARQLRERAQRN